MLKSTNNKLGLSVAVLLMLSLFTQVLPRPVITIANAAPKTESTTPVTTADPVNEVGVPKAEPAPTVAPDGGPSIVATLTDNITAATKVAPGGTINYTATITNNGVVSPGDDATGVNFSAPLDSNTTLVAGSVHASPIARNDTYNWVGNTQLDTAARALPAVTANDVAVNAPAGTDTFTVTAIAGGATSLGGTVTLTSPSGAFTYTPPVGRPNIADGASVNDTFTYTITNNADPSLTATGTVTITLTGRVWYLQAGAAGDGRSNTPSSSPAAMSTAADKSTDIFYIFSNAGSLNGPFSVDAGQQLLGQGVNLVVNAITLFTAAAPTPTTTNTAGSCVALAGAPGNNTLSGFNIGNCTGGTAITGANVGTLNVSTMSINTNGGGLDLTGVSTPTVSVVLGGLTSSGGAKNVNLVGLNGTFTLASGALSGATNNALDVNGGNAGITYSGTISNSGARQVSIINKTSGTVALSGAVSGTGTGIFLNANGSSIMNFTGGVVLSTTTNNAFTATGGGTVSVTGASNTLTTTTGTALNVASTNIGASGLTFLSINAGTGASGPTNGIILNTTGASGGLTVTGTGTTAGTGGTIQKTVQGALFTSTQNLTLKNMNFTNANSGNGTCNNIDDPTFNNSCQGAINMSSVTTATFDNLSMTNPAGAGAQIGINGQTVSDFTLSNTTVDKFGDNVNENDARLFNLTGTCTFTNDTFSLAAENAVDIRNNTGTLTLTVQGSPLGTNFTTFNDTQSSANGASLLAVTAKLGAIINMTVKSSKFLKMKTAGISTFARDTSTMNVDIVGGGVNANGNTFDPQGGLGRSVDLNAEDTAHLNFNVNNNPKMYGKGGPTINVFGINNAVIQGRINNNPDIRAGGDGQAGSAIFLHPEDSSSGIIEVLSNAISGVGNDPGIFCTPHGDGGANHSATLDVTIQSNTIAIANTNPGGVVGIDTRAGSNANDTIKTCVDVQSNAVTLGSGGGDVAFLTREGSTTPNVSNLYLEGMVAGANNQARAANTWSGRSNTPGASVFAFDAGSSAAYSAPPAGAPYNGVCRQPSNPTAMLNVRPAAKDYLAQTNQSTQPVESTLAANNLPMSSGGNAPSATLAGIKRILHPVAAFSAKLNFLQKSGAPVTSNHAVRRNFNAPAQKQNAPTSGETVSLNTIATFPAGGKSITIKYSATVNAPPLARSVSTQGTVSGSNFASVLTDDPEPAGGPQATVTLVDTTMTWNGATSTDWNTITNWTQPAGGTQYAPGVSNPAVNDVVIPNVGAQPNISATDIGVFSLNIANGRTLTITSPRVLTIGGSPGGDLTLDGIISGGNLNLGNGTHVINNAGGTGSLSSTNVATVLSGSTVTLNNNLQAGALAVNTGGGAVMNISNRTLSLNGSGAALAIGAGATFTTTGSTVVFNGTAAQQAAGTAYNNLTINNTIGTNITGVTLTGNATVNGTLTLTSSDLATGAFTLTQPNTTASAGVSDVVGTVTRSGGPFPLATALTFGNPNNIITFTAGTNRPTTLTAVMAKTAPATYAAAVQRNYTISQTGSNNSTATVRLHYLDTELNGNTPEANLNLRRLRTSDSHWTAPPTTTRDTANNFIETTLLAATDLPTQWTFSTFVPTAANGTISGRIADGNGNPVEGAVINLSGDQTRKTITDANGNYHFNEVGVNGFYTVTPSRVNYNFTPFNRSFNLIGNTADAAFGAISTGDNRNPLDTPEYFVRQQYVDILGREPDEGGFNYWSDQINQCLSIPPGAGSPDECIRSRRVDVAAAFFIEAEFQQTGSFIYDLYRGALGRRPVFTEYSNDRRQVLGGPNLDTEKAAFAQSFVQRPEFVAKYQSNPTAGSFVDALIQNVQQVSGVDLSSQRDALIDHYNTGTDLNQSRSFVLSDVAANSAFNQAQYNPAFVLTEYFGYLQRNPDQGGYDFWLNVINDREVGNYRGMVCAFITSTEYQRRFSSVVSHGNGECGP